jgi:predicted MFS family arabinose efflux permease
LGTVFQGIFQAFILHSRFAAADMASPAFRPKAISWVMTGGVAAAVFGTLLVIGTTDLLAPVTFAGCYVAMAVLCACAMAVLGFLDIPHFSAERATGSSRRMSEILKQPQFLVAVVAATVSYGMMNLVMTASPIAMGDCGFGYADVSWAIQWHVLAMFVPSFFTGHVIARFGAERICALGLVLLGVAAAVAIAGIKFENFAVGLILLGLGWNLGFIGGTTLLTQCYEPAEAAKVQAFNDFAVFGTVAVASLVSGQLLAWLGWLSVNVAVFPLVLVTLALIGWLALRGERRTV